ncbi:ras-related protein Rac1-like isoform X2 [Dreissena polymorpha]|uniref:ras-related protein Rac1-like isoform X2 n=1 Tax=Dreissena polymorpha TaxID=45954 RepID=UPI00226421C9|nr:ras-related protein Rac1-like isoform X2 [Dreissena polymorpha]
MESYNQRLSSFTRRILCSKQPGGSGTQEYTPSAFDTYTSTYDVTDTYSIQLALWDTSGQDEFRRVRPISYSDADIILLCYSVGDTVSLGNVTTKWYPEIRENCPKQPVILVGCQKDLRDSRAGERGQRRDPAVNTYEQGMKAAKAIEAVMFTEVSAKTSIKSVRDVIQVAAMSSAGCKIDRKSATFRRRRSSFRHKRWSEIAEAQRTLRTEVAKSCTVM